MTHDQLALAAISFAAGVGTAIFFGYLLWWLTSDIVIETAAHSGDDDEDDEDDFADDIWANWLNDEHLMRRGGIGE